MTIIMMMKLWAAKQARTAGGDEDVTVDREY